MGFIYLLLLAVISAYFSSFLVV